MSTIAVLTRRVRSTRQGRPPRSRWTTGVLLAALVIAGGSYVAAPLVGQPPQRAPQPFVPIPGDVAPVAGLGDSAVTGSVDGRLPVEERLTFWADRVAARPDDFLSFVQLALVEAEVARLTVDIEAYQRALAAIDHSLELVPAYPPTIRARGSVRFALHDFAGALADARTVLEASPTDPAAIALSGDAALELGMIAEAESAYDRLDAIAPGPWLDVRRARLASVTGDGARALSLARKARLAAADAGPTDVAFYDYAVGEYARLAGDAVTARSGFEQALATRPSDIGALIGLARVDMFDGYVDDAIAGLRAAVAIAPQPESLSLLGDLLARTGDAAGSAEAFETVRFIGRLGSVQGAVYDRQLLRFELDHDGATTAVLDATRASAATRPDAAGHDLVAWAFYRLSRFDEAAVEIEAARADGADDARLRFHDGAIAIARGDRERGLSLLEAAVAGGPALDLNERSEALGLLGR